MITIYQNDKLEEKTKINFLIHETDTCEDPHGHDFMEIEFVVRGNVKQCINGKEYECGPNDFLFFYPGDIHSFTPHGEVFIINLVFSPELFTNMSLNKYFPLNKKIDSVVKLPEDERAKLIQLFSMMEHEFKVKDERYIYVLQSLLQTLVCCLLRYGYKDKELDLRIAKIIEFIDNDCTLTITDIAKKCGLCNNHVSRIFKEKTGVSLKTYLNQQRINKAYQLVQTTDMSIESIMNEIALSNKTHFYDLFKTYIGKTPGEIRKG